MRRRADAAGWGEDLPDPLADAEAFKRGCKPEESDTASQSSTSKQQGAGEVGPTAIVPATAALSTLEAVEDAIRHRYSRFPIESAASPLT